MRGVNRESKQEAYDVVVIGGGIGGLSVAALLAKAGKSVLLVERHDRPGGYAHGFRRRQFQFDSGVHLISGCAAEGYRNGSTIYKICRTVGIDSQALFISLPEYARASFPGFEVTLHAGEAAFVEALAEQFPREKPALLALIRLCRQVAEQAMLAEELLARSRSSRVSPASELAELFRYRRLTLAEVLDQFLSDPKLKSACAVLWPYLGLPPSRASFLYWATMMASYVYEGGYYCRGSFQVYADQLARAIERHGGEVLLNASVRRIMVEQGRASGIELENAQRIRAGIVVSNADATQTAELMLGQTDGLERYRQNLAELEPSLSIFVSYLATDLPLREQGHAHEAFLFQDWDHERSYQLTRQGAPNWFSATIPSLVDPALAPAGQHILLLTTLCPYDIGQSWRQAKIGFQQRLLAQAERHFPGLSGRLLIEESGSPRTLERYTLNRGGAAYGFAPSPQQIGPIRPDIRGALPGLFHVGHWTRPGGGVVGVSVSAQLAAQAILDIPEQERFWTALA